MSTQSLHFKLFLTRFSFKQMHFFHYQLKLETFLFFLELFLILIIFRKKYSDNHCVKSVRIWSFSGPHLTAFGINTKRYSVSLRIQSKYLKIWNRKTRNTNTFHKVNRFTSLISIRKNFYRWFISNTIIEMENLHCISNSSCTRWKSLNNAA